MNRYQMIRNRMPHSVVLDSKTHDYITTQITPKSQTLTVLSKDPETILSSLNCTQVTPSVWSLRVHNLSPQLKLIFYNNLHLFPRKFVCFSVWKLFFPKNHLKKCWIFTFVKRDGIHKVDIWYLPMTLWYTNPYPSSTLWQFCHLPMTLSSKSQPQQENIWLENF